MSGLVGDEHHAQAFLNDPNTKATMAATGVTGRPMVVAVQLKA